jgi:hypothetical protein
MRRGVALLILTTMLLTFTVGIVLFAHAEDGDSLGLDAGKYPSIQAERIVSIDVGGKVFIFDLFTVNSSEEFTGFQVGFDDFQVSERIKFDIWQEDEWIPLNYTFSTANGLNWYNLTFSETENLKFRASYMFLGLVTELTSNFIASIPIYPVLTYNASEYSVSIELPTDSVYVDTTAPVNFTHFIEEGNDYVMHVAQNFTSFSNVEADVRYVPSLEDKYILDCHRLERSVTVRQGDLRFEDSYEIENLGAPFSEFVLSIIGDASSISARDAIDSLNVVTEEGASGFIDVTITPKFKVRIGDVWKFTLAYSLPREGNIEKTGGESTLTFWTPDFSHYVRELTAKVYVPDGGQYIASEPDSTAVTDEGSSSVAIFRFGDRMPLEAPEIVVTLKESQSFGYFIPLGVAVAALSFVGTIYITRRRRKVTSAPVIRTKKPALSEFIEEYLERISLLKELDELVRRSDDSEIEREEFDQRSAEINRRQGELAGSLRQKRGELREEYPELFDRFKEIRGAEEDLARVEEDLKNMEVRLRARRVSRRDYQSRREDRFGRRRQIIGRMERALASLGSEGCVPTSKF